MLEELILIQLQIFFWIQDIFRSAHDSQYIAFHSLYTVLSFSFSPAFRSQKIGNGYADFGQLLVLIEQMVLVHPS